MDIATHILNGFLRQAYFLGDHWTLVVCAACGILHIMAAEPAGKPTFVGFAATTALAAGLASALDSTAMRPLPYILAGLCVLVVIFVARDQHSPTTLRHRAAGGVAVYAGAILMFAALDYMLENMEARAVAEVLAGHGDAGAMVRTGRNTLRTVVAWGMWLMGPAGIVVMLAQGSITHRPQPMTPDERVSQIRRPRPQAQYPDAPPSGFRGLFGLGPSDERRAPPPGHPLGPPGQPPAGSPPP